MKHRIIPILVASGLAAQADVLTSAQRFFGLGGQYPDYSEETGETRASVLDQAPYSPADSDLGVQEILIERGSREPVVFDLRRSILRTDSAPSGSSFTDRSSWVTVGSATVAWRPHLAYGWFADLGIGLDAVLYDRKNATNFENLNTRIGVYRVFPELDDTILFSRFEYQRLTTGSLSDDDYHATRIRTGIQKVLWAAPRHQVVASLSGAYEWSASPDSLERNELAAEVFYRYSFTDSIYGQLSARASSFSYDQLGRDDQTYAFAAELVWQMSERFTSSASLMFDKNVSDTLDSFNEYEAWSGGIALGVQYSF